MITKFQNNDPLYVLDETQSTALLRRYPHLIGKDPILIAGILPPAAPAAQTSTMAST
ncbi:MAG: hypothetical protein U1E83_01420 [Methylotetracoccus sp.]